jgi:PAS domain S-box-containing protein
MPLQPEIDNIRSRLINVAILATLIFITPAVASSVLRINQIGWHPIYLLHLTVTGGFLILFPFRNRIPLKVKTHVYLIFFMVMSLMGLISFKMAGGYYLVFVCIVLATLMYGHRLGVVYFAVYLIGISIIGYLHNKGILNNKLDFNTYLNNGSTWATGVFGHSFVILIIIYSAHQFYKLFTETIETLNKRSSDLRYSEERFRKFMENYPFPITIKNEALQYVYTNKAAADNAAIEVQDSDSKAIPQTYPESVAKKLSETDQEVFSKNEFVIVDVDGELERSGHQYYRVIKFPLEGPEGNTFIGSITINNTPQMLAEKGLEISEKKYELIFNGSIDGFVFYNQDLIILECNQSFCNMLGFSLDEIRQKSLVEITDPSCLGYEEKLLEKRQQNEKGQFGLIEKIYTHKNGSGIPVELNINKVELAEDTFFWAVVRDISERKKLEQELFRVMIESEEQERERYAKELHDGLGPILSTCKIYFHSFIKAKDDGKREDYARRTEELLEDAFNTITEISNNLSPDILRKYGLEHALNAFTKKLKMVTKISITIESNLSDRLDETIEFTIYRTLVELINNSVKHSEAEEIELHLFREGRSLHIAYRDNGIGFDYEQAKLSHKTFGLINMENRIRKIGGEYNLISSPGQGVNAFIGINVTAHD